MPAPPVVTTLRVLTVNIHKGYTAFNRRSMLHRLREAVRAVGSDLVFLQEVSGPTARGRSRHPALAGRSLGDHEYLADQIWADHAYGRNAVDDGGDHGNAVLSRYPIVRWDNHDVSLPGDEPRGMLHCIVQPEAPAAPLHLVCVHLGLRESHRRHQLNCLGRLLKTQVPDHAPLIVAGDFNDWRSNADALVHGTGLVEVFRLSDGAHARSFPASLPVLRLDRIYVRRAVSAHPLRLPRRPWSALSDHAPLAADIGFEHRVPT